MRRIGQHERIIGGLVVTLVLVSVLAVMAGRQFNREGAYRRFVSRPLNDGTRFTFLYPARLSHVDVTDRTVCVDDRRRNEKRALNFLRRLAGAPPLPAPATEFVQAHVTLRQKVARDRRTEVRGREGDRQLYHSVVITERKSGRRFLLVHNGAPQVRARFDPDDAAIIASFAVLGPGAPVP